MTKKRIGLGAIIITLALGVVACGSHRGHHGMNESKMLKRATSKLDLTDRQQEKLQLVLHRASSFKAEMQTQHSAIAEPLKESIKSAELDVDALNLQFADLETEFSTFRKGMISEYAEFHASLDETQRNKLATALEKMEKRHRH